MQSLFSGQEICKQITKQQQFSNCRRCECQYFCSEKRNAKQTSSSAPLPNIEDQRVVLSSKGRGQFFSSIYFFLKKFQVTRVYIVIISLSSDFVVSGCTPAPVKECHPTEGDYKYLIASYYNRLTTQDLTVKTQVNQRLSSLLIQPSCYVVCNELFSRRRNIESKSWHLVLLLSSSEQNQRE